MRIFFTGIIAFCFFLPGYSQSVGIGTSNPHPSSLLEINSTNKGFLFPRVNDTSSVSNPAKGLTVYSLASNKLWVYNGSNWQGAAANSSDLIWTSLSDSSAQTKKKFISINSDQSIAVNQASLQVNGNLLVQEPVFMAKTAPTAAQTKTMTNSDAELVIGNDSVFRVLDQGGAANYQTNQRGTVRSLLLDKSEQTGWNIKFNPNDFGIAAGDSLWISTVPYPACINNYIVNYTIDDSTPVDIVVSRGTYLYIIFRSDGAINSKGFDLTVRRIYSSVDERKVPPVNNSGNALYFSRGALGAGFNANALGEHSVALGKNAASYQQGAVAMGSGSEAREVNSIAIGAQSKSLEGGAVAVGNNNTASGSGSVAIGSSVTTIGYGSAAVGTGLITKAPMTYAIGQYNDTTERAFSIPTQGDRVFQVGNGEMSARSTALTVLRNGNIGIGHNLPEAALHFKSVLGNRRLVLWQTVPNNDFEYFGFGINDYTLRYNVANGSSHSFYCTNVQVFTINSQGNALLRGVLSQNSDARLKTNILPLQNSLSQLSQLNGYSYNWRDPSRSGKQQIGLLAQEVQKLYPQLVSEDESGNLSVNYNGLTPVLIEALKELNAKVEELEKQISAMKHKKR